MLSNSITFGLVHGSWHGAWCWEKLRTELESYGHDTIAMDLPINEPTANFDDYADIVVDSLSNKSNIVLVGHSRAGNVLPRAAGKLIARKMIFLCSSFETSTIGYLSEEERLKYMPPRNTPEFIDGIIELGGGLTIYDSELSKRFMYNQCNEEVQQWASAQLKPQYRNTKDPSLLEWPNVPCDYILGMNDKAVLPAWSAYAAREWLNCEPIIINSDHSPFFSMPQKLATLLINLATI